MSDDNQDNENGTKRKVAIFVHEGVELLDFGGPGEVFAAARGFDVYTFGLSREPITSQGFLTVTPEHDLESAPAPDIVVLPGGDTHLALGNPALVEWIRRVAENAEVMLSVCTGAFLLAEAGLLDGRKATTWHGRIERLRETATQTEVLEGTRWVDSGKIVTTAGVSAGIDGALHVVSRLVGHDEAVRTARYMEYDRWNPDDGTVAAA